MTARGLARATQSARAVATGALVMLGASIPVSTALDGILTGVVAICWILAARYRETLRLIRENPVCALACVWFALHVVGAFYSIGEPPEVLRSLGKSALFLLIPLAAGLMDSPEHVRRAHYAFMAAIGLTVMLSWLRWLQVVPADAPFLKSTGFSASVVFKYHLTQNLIVAFGAFLFAVYARSAESARGRYFFAACAAACVLNVLLIGDGRLGQMILFVLAAYYGSWLARGKGLAVAVAATLAVAAAAYVVPGSSLQKRSAVAASELEAWQRGGEVSGSSAGERLHYFSRAVETVRENPIAGVGTGGFIAADRAAASRTGTKPTDNPHNEYLLQAVELGLAGALLMLAIFVAQWRAARTLASARDAALARGLTLMYLFASLGTTMLTDHVEALLFVWMTGLLFARAGCARSTATAARDV